MQCSSYTMNADEAAPIIGKPMRARRWQAAAHWPLLGLHAVGNNKPDYKVRLQGASAISRTLLHHVLVVCDQF